MWFKGAESPFTNENSLQGKTILLTGGTGGIGLAAVKKLVQFGAHVIFTGRREKTANLIVNEIKNEFPNAKVEFFKADNENLSDMKKLSDYLNKKFDKLDVFINNAGTTGSYPKNLTKDGFETCLQANYLAPFYLTSLLLPLLEKANEGRIIIVSSMGHINNPFGIEMPFNNPLNIGFEPNYNIMKTDLNWEKRQYEIFSSYSESKLLITMFMKCLQDFLTKKSSSIKCVSINPGAVKTGIFDAFGGKMVPLFNLVAFIANPFIWLIFKKPEEGAQTIFYTTLMPFGLLKDGAYYDECTVSPISKHITKENCKDLWEKTLRMLDGKIEGKVF